MAIKYAVLWGKHGAKSFRKIERARDFAKMKANKTQKKIEIDKVKTYSKAKVGEIDWSQGHHSYILPKKKKKKR